MMKKGLVAAIVAGIIVFGMSGYLYGQMYDCLFPPLWMKLPRSYNIGDCLQMYADGTLPDYTKARENYAKEQTHRDEMIDKFKDRPEVVAFYDKYDDANVSVRDGHVSYFAGNNDEFQVRMNFYLDEDTGLDYIEFHCFVGKKHQTQVAQEDILNYLLKHDCGDNNTLARTEHEPQETVTDANVPDDKVTNPGTNYESAKTEIHCKGTKLCLTEEVTRIIDGDTIYLSGGYKVRLSLTNTPERHEMGFYEASQFTKNLCPVGSRVTVDQDDLQPYDVYDRLLGKVICKENVLNAELLYNDHGNILTRYCQTSEFSNEKWAQEFGC